MKLQMLSRAAQFTEHPSIVPEFAFGLIPRTSQQSMNTRFSMLPRSPSNERKTASKILPAVFEKVSGFSTRYIYGHYEDADLSLRWKASVGPVMIDSDTGTLRLCPVVMVKTSRLTGPLCQEEARSIC